MEDKDKKRSGRIPLSVKMRAHFNKMDAILDETRQLLIEVLKNPQPPRAPAVRRLNIETEVIAVELAELAVKNNNFENNDEETISFWMDLTKKIKENRDAGKVVRVKLVQEADGSSQHTDTLDVNSHPDAHNPSRSITGLTPSPNASPKKEEDRVIQMTDSIKNRAKEYIKKIDKYIRMLPVWNEGERNRAGKYFDTMVKVLSLMAEELNKLDKNPAIFSATQAVKNALQRCEEAKKKFNKIEPD